MKTFESWMLSYLLNSLWQAPLLFAAGWIAARALKKAGPAAEHRVWVSVLLLQALLPACSTVPGDWWRTFFAWAGHARDAGDAHVSVVMGAGSGLGGFHLPAMLLTGLALAYAAVIGYFAARFAWRWIRLCALRREAVEIALTGEAAREWARYAERFGIEGARLAASTGIFGPVTMGVTRQLVLIPATMAADLPDADLRTVMAHEFAHMRRNDFLKNLIYEMLSLPVSYHPLLWLTRERIMESREMVCDRMAAQISGRGEYAQSLLRLASLLVKGMPVTTPHAIGIFDANAFERRLMKLKERQGEVRGLRRLAMVTACAAFGMATCGTALSLGMHVNAAPSASASDDTKPSKPLNVSAAEMAGNKLPGPNPKYPPEAKKAKIQGKVLLNAVIGKDGTIQKLTVVSGPKELQQSSLDAVRQWTYKPYLLNGDPVEVETTISVIYTLAK